MYSYLLEKVYVTDALTLSEHKCANNKTRKQVVWSCFNISFYVILTPGGCDLRLFVIFILTSTYLAVVYQSWLVITLLINCILERGHVVQVRFPRSALEPRDAVLRGVRVEKKQVNSASRLLWGASRLFIYIFSQNSCDHFKFRDYNLSFTSKTESRQRALSCRPVSCSFGV